MVVLWYTLSIVAADQSLENKLQLTKYNMQCNIEHNFVNPYHKNLENYTYTYR